MKRLPYPGRFAIAAAVPVILVLLWHAASAFEWVHPYLLPSPLKVARTAADLIQSGALPRHLGVSFLRIAGGFSITLLAALPLSFLIHALPGVKLLLKAPLEFLRSVPPLAAIPLLILWFGIGEASKTAVIVMASFFPVFLSLLGGLNNVDEKWRELARSLRFNHMEYIRFVLFPSAFPAFLTGIQLGVSYCWRALMGAEMIAAASGVGYLILDSQEMGRIDRVFVGIFTLGVCGIILDRLLLKLFNALVPWKDLEEDQKW
ncbi:MAG: ABC transporter permease [Spirochaetales bacterium]|nr:ABC transporter permease [Spirochaetales bacterium]